MRTAARAKAAMAYALIPAATCLAWWALAEFAWVRPLFLPTPRAVFETTVRLWQSGELTTHVTASCARIFWGFLLTAVLAFPVGMTMGLSDTGRRLFQPLNSLFRYMPFPAFVPLLILWFGLGTQTQVGVVLVGTFFQLTVLVQDAFGSIPPQYIETARSLAFSRRRMFFRVQLPAALPQCYDAARMGIGWSWTCLIVAEMVGANDGLGYLVIVGQRFLNTPQVFAGILVIGLIGLIIDSGIRLLRPFVVPWATAPAA
jgi:NitT/TauT family transport system permease protein